MFRLICKTLIQSKTLDSKLSNVRYLQTWQSLNSVQICADKQSLTASYLMNSCGLSLESALSASKVISIKRTEKSDSVIKLLVSHGFTKNHIAMLISKQPSLILANAEKILKPKIEFYESLGILGPELPKILCSNKRMLLCSLKNQIIPTVEFLKGYVESNEKLVQALKQSTRVIQGNIQEVMLPNITTLRAHGVPKKNIGRLITLHPRAIMLRNDLFEKVVNAIREMDLDPLTCSFVLAVGCMSVTGTDCFEKKKELFLSFGWSEKDFVFAFRVQPMIIMCSVKKISAVTEFFVKEMGLNSLSLAKCPNLFLTSLERRIIPRLSVLQILMSKGLIRKNLDVVWSLNSSKVVFERKFVNPYEDVPMVIKAYQGTLGIVSEI